MRVFGSGFGTLIQCAVIALHVVLVFIHRHRSADVTAENRGLPATVFIQIVPAIDGIGAAVARSRLLMLLTGTIQLVPIGVHILVTPGIFRRVGIARLGYLFSAGLLLMGVEVGVEEGCPRRTNSYQNETISRVMIPLFRWCQPSPQRRWQLQVIGAPSRLTIE